VLDGAAVRFLAEIVPSADRGDPVASDIMEVDGPDARPEPLQERRKRLAKLLPRKTKAMRDGIQFREAITGDGATIFRHACGLALEASFQIASACGM
jgi:ATP-dependent DNA ligase